MNTRKKAGTPKRPRVGLSATPEQYARWERAAAKEKLKVSTFAKRAVEKECDRVLGED